MASVIFHQFLFFFLPFFFLFLFSTPRDVVKRYSCLIPAQTHLPLVVKKENPGC